jgi:hypothetical protein
MTKIDDRAVPIPAGTLDSILIRVKGVNSLWAGQQSSETYLDFPDSFPVRTEFGELVGHLVWDEGHEWIFQPVTHDAQDLDRRERAAKKQPEPPKY